MFKRVLMSASALLLGASGAFADDSGELAAMKASLEKLQGQMAARDAQVGALQRQLDESRINDRMNAGGEPAALQSANGKAALTIGGQVRVRYQTGWSQNGGVYDATTNPRPNARVQSAGWAIQRVELNFGIKLSDDTKALISLRPSGNTQGGNWIGNGQLLNQAYWDWNNIGGSGLGLRVGYQYVPFGGWTGEDGAWSWDGTYAYAPSFVSSPGRNAGVNGADEVPVAIGAIARYKFLDDQLIMKAGILGSDLNAKFSNGINNPGVNNRNELRNIGLVDHIINVVYNPCWIEGLHLEAGYWGRFNDDSYDGINPPNTLQRAAYRNNYSAAFNAQAYYKTDKWKFVAEWQGVTSPREGTLGTGADNPNPTASYVDGFANLLSAYAYYNVTDKLVLDVGADYARLTRPDTYSHTAAFNSNEYNEAFQVAVGAGYTFSNGIITSLGYAHKWQWTPAPGTLNTDTIQFQTAYKF
ncbi:hypothetical protein FACS1894139_01900 [Planctomycetales bacterium]|nr:hypothetical protein FACS1894107_10640 [Planctomycetales bacterium]GHS96793.1 hypothetical protein FACS1894108_02020 [Planctomycetales bacterium]GHT02870.1 hypothetical protein FACS1894139_01900 [Planctomycetales bacterium]